MSETRQRSAPTRLNWLNWLRRIRGGFVLSLCVLTAGCSGSPTIAILGAYFPDWLFCIAGAVLAVACVHVLLSRSGRGALLEPPALVYPALTVLFAVALWTAGFNL
ncbi:YtcA family lipoprotein [Burkholderia sp. 9120]|nr:YtcA family lipoprotein [Burkholderia sp. 9120]